MASPNDAELSSCVCIFEDTPFKYPYSVSLMLVFAPILVAEILFTFNVMFPLEFNVRFLAIRRQNKPTF